MSDPKLEDLCPLHDLDRPGAECTGPWTCLCGEIVNCGEPCPDCDLPAHPCRRSATGCPRMPAVFPIQPPEAPKLTPTGSCVVAATPQHPAFAYPCPECLSEPYTSCRNDLGDYITHKMVHVARTRVGAPVDDEGEPVFRAKHHDNPAQDIARLAYWLRFVEATGVTLPTACKTEVAAAVARWPLGEAKR